MKEGMRIQVSYIRRHVGRQREYLKPDDVERSLQELVGSDFVSDIRLDKFNTSFAPDHEAKCNNCGETPSVQAIDDHGDTVERYRTCGLCYFGSPDAVDIITWNKIYG